MGAPGGPPLEKNGLTVLGAQLGPRLGSERDSRYRRFKASGRSGAASGCGRRSGGGEQALSERVAVGFLVISGYQHPVQNTKILERSSWFVLTQRTMAPLSNNNNQGGRTVSCKRVNGGMQAGGRGEQENWQGHGAIRFRAWRGGAGRDARLQRRETSGSQQTTNAACSNDR